MAYQWAFQNTAHHEVSRSVDEMQCGYRSLTDCYQCGESRHRTSQGCPAKGATCHKCGGKDHWAKAHACPQRDSSRQMQQGHSRSKGRGRGRGRGSRHQRSVHSINHGDDYEYDGEGGTDVQFDALTIAVDTLGIKESAYATLNVCLPGSADSKTFRVKVDAGAEGNISLAPAYLSQDVPPQP